VTELKNPNTIDFQAADIQAAHELLADAERACEAVEFAIKQEVNHGAQG